MNEKNTTNNEFVREKIKDKPVNKKRVVTKLLFSALCGLIFAVVACIVFALILPRIESLYKRSDTMVTEANSGSDSKDAETLPSSETATEQLNTQSSDSQVTDSQVADSQTANPKPEDGREDTTTTAADATEDAEGQQMLSLEDYQRLQNDLYKIGQQGNSSIVTVTSVVSDVDIFHNTVEEKGQDCGVIIGENDTEYLILTECENIADASGITVSFVDDYAYEATLKQEDTNIGIAILSVPKKAIQKTTLEAISVAQIGYSSLVREGTLTIALGNLLGSNYTILTGYVTSVNGTISADDYNFQTFSTNMIAANAKSGILMNVDGEVIGIVISKLGAQGSQNTLSAVALSNLEPVINMLCEAKPIPYVGVQVSTVTDRISEEYGVPQGVYIREVAMDSPAMEAGLQKGDVIISVSGTDIYTDTGYAKVLRSLEPDDTVTVSVRRKGANGYAIVSCDVKVGIK